MPRTAKESAPRRAPAEWDQSISRADVGHVQQSALRGSDGEQIRNFVCIDGAKRSVWPDVETRQQCRAIDIGCRRRIGYGEGAVGGRRTLRSGDHQRIAPLRAHSRRDDAGLRSLLQRRRRGDHDVVLNVAHQLRQDQAGTGWKNEDAHTGSRLVGSGNLAQRRGERGVAGDGEVHGVRQSGRADGSQRQQWQRATPDGHRTGHSFHP